MWEATRKNGWLELLTSSSLLIKAAFENVKVLVKPIMCSLPVPHHRAYKIFLKEMSAKLHCLPKV